MFATLILSMTTFTMYHLTRYLPEDTYYLLPRDRYLGRLEYLCAGLLSLPSITLTTCYTPHLSSTRAAFLMQNSNTVRYNLLKPTISAFHCMALS